MPELMTENGGELGFILRPQQCAGPNLKHPVGRCLRVERGYAKDVDPNVAAMIGREPAHDTVDIGIEIRVADHGTRVAETRFLLVHELPQPAFIARKIRLIRGRDTAIRQWL